MNMAHVIWHIIYETHRHIAWSAYGLHVNYIIYIPFIGPLRKKDKKIFFVRIASFLNTKNFTFENISIDNTFSRNKN